MQKNTHNCATQKLSDKKSTRDTYDVAEWMESAVITKPVSESTVDIRTPGAGGNDETAAAVSAILLSATGLWDGCDLIFPALHCHNAT